MRIVIDISEKDKEIIDDMNFVTEKLKHRIGRAIMNGTVLPKGHGRLIDADKFSEELLNASLYYRGENADIFDTRYADGLKAADEKLVDAPTILVANMEG